jgi:starch synthase
LKIAFVTPELQSLVRRTNLAEVSEALPSTLAREGHDARIFIPHCKELNLEALEGLSVVGQVRVADTNGEVLLTLREGWLGDLRVVLFEHPQLFGSRHPYGDEDGPYADNWRRYSIFSRAVLECLEVLSFSPDILHCFDWTTGLIPLYREFEYRRQKPKHPASKAGVYFTIHNLAMQGTFEREILPGIGVPLELFQHVKGVALDGRVNYLKAGAEFATIIGTHSATLAQRIQQLDRGYGLEDTFSRRKKELVGITNGIDYSAWNPANDPLIASKYSAESAKDLAGKKRCKTYLQQAFRLDKGPRTPVISIIGRLDTESGFDIVAEVLTNVLERNFEVIMMGQGQESIIERVRTIEGTFTGRCRMIEGYQVETAHQALAGSDILILPSHFLASMSLCAIGMRYGAIPIVYEHAGADDIIVDQMTNETNGTAFTFKAHTSDGLITAIDAARTVYKSATDWAELTLRCMTQDFSWKRCGAEYIKAYRRVTRRVRSQRDSDEE